MKLYLMLCLSLSLTACSIEHKTFKANDVIVVLPTNDITSLIGTENEHRFALGQAPLTNGLTCTLYTVPNGSGGIVGTALTSVASYTMVGSFNQENSSANDGLNILPPALRPLYTSWYVVRCSGKIVITQSGYQAFELSSDDGSLLYVGGTLVINNDGNHGVVTKAGMKYLRQGVHDFRLDYMQGPAGNQALILTTGGTLLSSSLLFH